MSAIRPPTPSPLFPTQSPPSPVRASRSDFFRAALDETAAPAESKAAAPERSVPPADFFHAGDRPQRPGALLDIRV